MSEQGIDGHHRAHRGATDDWITPRHIIEALGPFDLDPCACAPMPWPTAKTMWTESDDGLSRVWSGRVWLNPPYGPRTGKWRDRLARHSQSAIGARGGVALVFARTETEMFFSSVRPHADALLFLQKRLYFHYPDGRRAKGNAGGPSVLIAYGKENVAALRGCGLAGALVENPGVIGAE